MIALKEQTHIVKLWKSENGLHLIFHLILHPDYGWIETSTLPARDAHRRKQGFKTRQHLALVPEMTVDSKSRLVLAQLGTVPLQVQQQGDLFHVLVNSQTYTFDWIDDVKISIPLQSEKQSKTMGRLIGMFALLVLIFAAYRFFRMEPTETGAAQNQIEEAEVIKLEAVSEKKPIVPEAVPQEQKNQAIDETTRAQKAVTQNLGFLKMLGRKDLKKAVGGLPTTAAQATAGAGAGGDKGSGGELLTGVGDGLRKTTVGNTGTKGLGGIGTEGAGGGLGGYGDSLISSGAGRTLSTVPLARQATVEGGLDRSLIQATILRYLSQIRACYEEGLKQNPDMLGQVTTAFEINGQGLMNSVKILKSALNNTFVDGCISERMMTWKFPTPRGGALVKVTYPFMLRPVGK